MAIIKCPSCGREYMSDSTTSCPGCGYDFSGDIEELKRQTEIDEIEAFNKKRAEELQLRKAAETRKNRKMLGGVIAFLVLLIASVIWIVVSGNQEKYENAKRFNDENEVKEFLRSSAYWKCDWIEYGFYMDSSGDLKVKAYTDYGKQYTYSVRSIKPRKGSFRIDDDLFIIQNNNTIKTDVFVYYPMKESTFASIVPSGTSKPSYSSTTSTPTVSDKEQRCWYCSKVIVNSSGTVIHATHDALDMYICDYCGKTNVVKDK